MADADQAAAAAPHRVGDDRAWTPLSATSCARATRPSSSAAASSASAGGRSAEAYGITCVYVDVEWGKSVDAKAVAEAIEKNPGVRAVYATACETSTATKHDIEAIAKVVRAHDDIILCVDAITAIGVYDVPVDKWGLDVVAVGSQKALMLPPGLAAISVSEKAWKANERSNLPRFYLDLARERKSAGEGGDRASRRPCR